MNKVCTGCNRELPATLEYFHKKNGGFATRCKQCIKDYYQRYYKENHERVKNTKVDLSRDYYKNNKSEINDRRRKQYKDGTSAKKKYMDEYYKVKRDDILIKRKEYLATDDGWAKKKEQDQLRRSREKKLISHFSSQEWEFCKAFFENKCAYCGKEKPLTREHFIPLVKNGEYTINNIIPACKSCNSSKKNADFYEWYPKQRFHSKARQEKILKYLGYKNNIQQISLL